MGNSKLAEAHFDGSNKQKRLVTIHPLLPVFSTSPRHALQWRPGTVLKHVLLIIIILTSLSLALFSLRMFTSLALILGAPSIRLESLSVSRFHVTDSRLSGNWLVDFTFHNPNFIADISFNRIECFLSYKDHTVAIGSMEPFKLGLKEEKDIAIWICTTGFEGDQPVMKEWILEEIRNETRGDSAVSLSLQMAVWATYKTKWSQTKRVIMSPNCDGMDVQFVATTGFGRWFNTRATKCSVPVLKE